MAAAIGGLHNFEVSNYDGTDVLACYQPIDYQLIDHRPWVWPGLFMKAWTVAANWLVQK